MKEVSEANVAGGNPAFPREFVSPLGPSKIIFFAINTQPIMKLLLYFIKEDKMGFIGTTLAAGTIIGDCVMVKIVTSAPAIEAMKEKAKDVVQDVVEDSVRKIFNFK